MNLGSDPADQVVRYTLEGTEYALRLSGTAAKNFAIFVAAVLRDQKKTRGKTNLTRLLREGKPLKFFSVPTNKMREFAHPNHIEIAIWADDAAKVERIIDRMQLDVVAAGEAEIVTQVDREAPAQEQASPDRQLEQTDDIPFPFDLNDPDNDLGFTSPAPQRAEPDTPSPSRSTRRNVPPSEQPSTSRSRSPNISPKLRAEQARNERPSVRDELRSIKVMLRQRESVTPQPKTPIRIQRRDRAR